MKVIETKLYSFDELTDEAKDRVIREKADQISSDPDNFTLDECMDSLKAVAKAMGVKLKDWCIGPYKRNNHVDVDSGLCGPRALAHFLNVLIAHGYPRPRRFSQMKFEGTCGFTGVCFDEDICEEMWKALLEGETVGKAFDRAGDRIMRICEDDLRYLTSREGILENLDTRKEIYTEDGAIF